MAEEDLAKILQQLSTFQLEFQKINDRIDKIESQKQESKGLEQEQLGQVNDTLEILRKNGKE